MSSSTAVDLSTYDTQQLSSYFMQLLTVSDTAEMGRVGMEMTNRLFMSQQSHQQAALAPTSTSQVIKLKFEKPQPYDGDPRTLSDFCFAVTQYLDNVGEQDAVRRQQFASALLTKRALTWWRTLLSPNPGLHATMMFDRFLIELRSNFRDVNHERRTRTALYALKQQKGDTVQFYIARFRALCTELGSAKPDDATCLFQFVNGLRNDISFHLDLDPPVSLAQAELRAEQIFQAIRLRQGAPRSPDTFQPRVSNTSSSFSRTPRGAPMVLGSVQNTQQQRVNAGNNRVFTCYRCGKQGHTSRYCRAPVPLLSQGVRPQNANSAQPVLLLPSSEPNSAAVSPRKNVVKRDNNKRSRSVVNPSTASQLKN